MALAVETQAVGEDIQAVADYTRLEDTLLEAVVRGMAAVFRPCFVSFCLNANFFFPRYGVVISDVVECC